MAADESTGNTNQIPKKVIYGKEPPFPWRDVSIAIAILAALFTYIFDLAPPIERILEISQPYIETLRSLWISSFDKGGLILAGIILGWLITRAFSTRTITEDKTSMGLPVWNSQSGGTAEKRQLAFPPPYPNGWYRVGLSKDLPPMSVKPLRVLGRDLAIFRGQDGKVGVLAAFCTHLGAHLGIDSRVVGNCIECPFHGWTFDTSGKCTSIPYSDAKIPEQAHTEAYVVKEYHGHILLWYDAEKRQPEYDIPDVPEIVSGKYTYRSTSTLGLVSMHLQDLAENAADYAHFQQVHAVFYFPILSYFFYIRHNTTWEQDENQPHISYFHNTTNLVFKWGDRVVPFSTTETLVAFHGPGALTLWRFRTYIGDVFMFKAFTPLETLKLRMEEVVYASKWFPNFMVKFMCAEAARALSDDFNIWSNKTYQRKPLCVKGDGPIMKLRRWYNQFYSPNSKVAAQPGSEMEW